MSTERNNDHPGHYGSVVFLCDEIGCSEDFDTEYTTWDYALPAAKREGWYAMLDRRGAWEHFCPEHGKARFIAQKDAERVPFKLPWMKD